MNIISWTVIVLFIFIIVMEFIFRKNLLAYKYQNMDFEKIIQEDIFAKNQMKLFLFIALLGPIPLGFIISRISDKSVREIVISLGIIIVMGSIAEISRYRKIMEITENIIRLRELKKWGIRDRAGIEGHTT